MAKQDFYLRHGNRFGELLGSRATAAAVDAWWREFAEEAAGGEAEPLYHIAILLKHVERYRGDRPKAALRIVDHGCGSGMTLLNLAACGYRNIHGFELRPQHDFKVHNRIARTILGHDEDRFVQYDGARIPLPDASVDTIFSQQVIEHVDPELFDQYNAEEGRVLNPAGSPSTRFRAVSPLTNRTPEAGSCTICLARRFAGWPACSAFG